MDVFVYSFPQYLAYPSPSRGPWVAVLAGSEWDSVRASILEEGPPEDPVLLQKLSCPTLTTQDIIDTVTAVAVVVHPAQDTRRWLCANLHTVAQAAFAAGCTVTVVEDESSFLP